MTRTGNSRTVIVTGASEGIGFAVSKRMLENGHKIAMLGRSRQKMDLAISRMHGPDRDRVLPVIGDVTDARAREQLVHETVSVFGGVDVLVNNAGGGTENRFIEDIDDEDLRYSLSFNLESAFSMTRLCVPTMKQNQFGRVINISSVAGRDAGRLSGPQYAAAKAGMVGMSRHLAQELAEYGITVNTIAPGLIMTERAYQKWSRRPEGEREQMMDGTPVRRFGTPDEVAVAVDYFIHDLSGYTTGACLDINGGSFLA